MHVKMTMNDRSLLIKTFFVWWHICPSVVMIRRSWVCCCLMTFESKSAKQEQLELWI